MKPECQQIKEWYKALKAECTCPICEKEGLEVKPGNVEFHHIDPSTKSDHLSNMVYKNLIHPDSYGVVMVAVEFMKCAPICPTHHKAIHKDQYDLTEPFYKQKCAEFRSNVINTLPPTLMDKVLAGVMHMPMVL